MTRALLALALGVGSIAARAAADAPRPVIVLGAEATEVLAERLEGQLSDLDVVVSRAPGSLVEASVAARATEAAACAEGTHGALVIWAELRAPEPRVYLLDVDAQLLFARGLDPQATGSAAIESAAVILRTAVQAALAGQPLGVPEAEAIAAAGDASPMPREPTGETTTRDAVVAQVASPPVGEELGVPSVAPSREAAEVRLGLGWRGEIDGASSAGAHGVWLDASVWLGPFGIGVLVEAGVPIDVASTDVHFALSRHAALLALAYRVALADVLALELGLAGGAAGFDRDASVPAGALVGTGTAWSFAAIFAAFTRWVWSPIDALSAWVALGADVATPRPTFVVRRATGDAVVAELFPVSPRIEVGLAFRIPIAP